jgi:hypothetical protein
MRAFVRVIIIPTDITKIDMITFATKLHILLIMIVIGIGLYMFLLFKEVKMFGEDMDQMRLDIGLLKSQQQCAISPPAKAITPAVAPRVVEYDDDNISVTSNEIKNILTNIRHDDEEEEEEDKETVEQPLKIVDIIDMTTFTLDELKKQKYDDLRAFLRRRNLNIKGTKSELIQKITELKSASADVDVDESISPTL